MNEIICYVEQEEYVESPREWRPFGTIASFHYLDEHDESGLPMEERFALGNNPDVIAIPIYVYDHSGVRVSATRFSCEWDSAQLGFIYVPKSVVKEVYNWHELTEDRIEEVCDVLRREIQVLDQYFSGDVWYYHVEQDGVVLESEHGIYGYDYAMELSVAARVAAQAEEDIRLEHEDECSM